MKSLVITAFMLLTLAVGANAQENQKVFTAEEQAIVDLSNSKWDWMSYVMENGKWQLSTLAFTRTLGE